MCLLHSVKERVLILYLYASSLVCFCLTCMSAYVCFSVCRHTYFLLVCRPTKKLLAPCHTLLAIKPGVMPGPAPFSLETMCGCFSCVCEEACHRTADLILSAVFASCVRSHIVCDFTHVQLMSHKRRQKNQKTQSGRPKDYLSVRFLVS